MPSSARVGASSAPTRAPTLGGGAKPQTYPHSLAVVQVSRNSLGNLMGQDETQFRLWRAKENVRLISTPNPHNSTEPSTRNGNLGKRETASH